MTSLSTTSVKSEDVILLLGRVALGAIFVKSGLQKLMALSGFAASLASRGIPQSSTWAVIGATVEFVGGIIIVTGFRARPASLLMILFVIIATGTRTATGNSRTPRRGARRRASSSRTSRSSVASCCSTCADRGDSASTPCCSVARDDVTSLITPCRS